LSYGGFCATWALKKVAFEGYMPLKHCHVPIYSMINKRILGNLDNTANMKNATAEIV